MLDALNNIYIICAIGSLLVGVVVAMMPKINPTAGERIAIFFIVSISVFLLSLGIYYLHNFLEFLIA